MNNAEKFQEVFGLYATELWAKPYNEFLGWLSAEYTQNEKTARHSKESSWDKDIQYEEFLRESQERGRQGIYG